MRFWERIRLLAEQVPPGGSIRWWWDDGPVLAFDTEASALEVIDESSTQSQLRRFLEAQEQLGPWPDDDEERRIDDAIRVMDWDTSEAEPW